MKKKFSLQIFAFTITRLIIDALFRLFYPFAADFGVGLGISYAQVVRSLSWRSIPGFFGPFFASLADSHGRKTGMLLGLSSLFLGLAVVVLWPTFTGFVVMLVLTATSKYIFDPAMRAHLGDSVPYERRGFFMAIIEMGWSGSFLLIVPVVGFFISRWGWLSPFPLLLVLSVILGLVLFRLVPADLPVNANSKNLFKYFEIVFSSSTARASLVVSVLIALGSEIINLVFGVWLKDSFGLQIVAIGGAAAVFGFAELSGESLVILFTDRLGKKRAVTIGLFGTTLAALLLPVLGTSVTGALASLFFFFLCYEFTFVSLNPIMTEVAPNSRATLLAMAITAYAVGRWIAALVTPSLYDFGIGVTAGTAGAIYFLSWLALQGVKGVDEV